ncbi:MAG: pseudouridine-5'-phosphate glycosidase [Gemmataceae bacterium]
MVMVRPEVRDALDRRRPVVALESTLIAHGLPWPVNVETALAAEAAVRAEGAVPATIAVLAGAPVVGLSADEINALGQNRDVLKASRRDLAAAMAQGKTAATTVAATVFLAHRAGIHVFATGGIGGVHRGAEATFDISADLLEIARTPVCVVCAGAKSILDIPKTLELLEALGVPVIGYRTDSFPAFYVRSSGLPVAARVESPEYAATLARTHFGLGGGGLLLAQPVAEDVALSEAEFVAAFAEAERAVGEVRGPALTPALLAKLAEVTAGRSLTANRELILANARLAARVARCFSI